jgi:signal transduction histidine kinase
MPAPAVKPAYRSIIKGLLLGAAVGVLAGHPLFMVAHHLHEHFGHRAPLAVTQTIFHSFSLHAWPLTLFFALTGGLIGAVLARLYHRLEAHRLDYQERLRALAADLSLVEERERRRLATELHEQVGQILAMAQLKLGLLSSRADSPAALPTLQEVREDLGECIKYIRSLTGELSPPILYELGFAAAVEWFARWLHDQYGIEVEIKQDHIVWPPCHDGQILLFIVVRDLLTYVARQTKAHRIKISMGQAGDNLRIRVEHDGEEIRAADRESAGFALFSIRERLERIGGVLEEQAPPDRDQTFVIKAPFCQIGA